MLKRENLDEIVRQFQALLPEDMRRTRQDMEQNVRAAMRASLQRMDLVTREEFEIQSELLLRSRCLLEDLEKRVQALEMELNRAKEDKPR